MNIFSREGQVKTMETTVSHTEKFLGEFCSLLASYTRKTAKLRDKADLLATQMLQYANTEDQESRTTLKNLAEDLAMVQDYRQAQVERLETRVVGPLKAYGDIVKSKRADLKKFSAERNRELKELQKLEKLRQRNPADRQVISQAEVTAQKATNNAQRCTRQLEDTIIDFQRQKLEDIKKIFTDFITVEMIFHAKALEVFSHTFQNLECMDIDKDMEVFTGRVRVSDGPLDNMPLLSSSSLALRSPSPRASSSLAPHASTGSPLRRTADTARRAHHSTLRRQRGVEEEDEEEDDEEEEEEEMYESEIEEVHSPRLSYAAQYSQIHRKHK